MVSTRTMSNVSEGGDNPSSAVVQGSSKQCTVKQSRPSTEKAQDPPVPEKTELNLQYLPTEIFENIVSYLPHRTIGQMRLVSRKMDSLCSGILNFKFQRLQTLMLTRFQSIKAKMPRRESARRNHPLACEADIIETLHMRLTLLQMTFGKHIERKHCCFFAGEILDECYRIIQYIKVTQKLSRPYKVTDELFDLSTMAMEYFKEHIEPTLPEIAYFTSSDFLEFVPDRNPAPFTRPVCVYDEPSTPVAIPSKIIKRSDSSCGHGGIALRNSLRCIKTGMKRHNNQLMIMRREIRNSKSKMLDQQKQILDYSKRLDENEKKNEENSRKFSTFLQELNKCKTELQYWRSKSPAVLPNCDACGRAFGVPNDEAGLVNQGILPEGWPDVHVAPVVAIINRDEVVGEFNVPLQNVVKKPEELKAGDSKQVAAKDVKVPVVKDVKAPLCPKRKIEDEDVKVGISSSKPKEVKTTTGSKKIKLAAAKEKACDLAPTQAEGSLGRRVLKPRVKQGKMIGKS